MNNKKNCPIEQLNVQFQSTWNYFLLYCTPNFNCSILLPLAIPLLQFSCICISGTLLHQECVAFHLLFPVLILLSLHCLPSFAPSTTLHTVPHLIIFESIYLHCRCPKCSCFRTDSPFPIVLSPFPLFLLVFLWSTLLLLCCLVLHIRRWEGRRGDYVLQSGQGLCKIVAKVELASLERRIRRPKCQSRPSSPPPCWVQQGRRSELQRGPIFAPLCKLVMVWIFSLWQDVTDFSQIIEYMCPANLKFDRGIMCLPRKVQNTNYHMRLYQWGQYIPNRKLQHFVRKVGKQWHP